MEVIYGLITGMVFLGLVAVGVLFWAARSGQFDELEGDGQRILMDDDELPVNEKSDLKQETPAADEHLYDPRDERDDSDAS